MARSRSERQSISDIKRTLSQDLALLGEDHPDTLRSMSNLAAAYQQQGDYITAKEIQEQVVERRQRISGDDDYYTIQARHDLARVLVGLGDRDLAKTIQEEVLTACRKELGDHNEATLAAMVNLTNSLLF